ncbi:MAG: hypothetical protein EOO43_13765 [Flavobacterium sp.]|nr:MAG: hypothetical protein EOO43_13765 [Flavobacterium sp.]
MSLENLALRCGVEESDLQDLIYGHVRRGIEEKLDIPSNSIQTFLDGGTSAELASKMGVSSSELQFLRYQSGKEGAVGLLIGLMLTSKKTPAT